MILSSYPHLKSNRFISNHTFVYSTQINIRIKQQTLCESAGEPPMIHLKLVLLSGTKPPVSVRHSKRSMGMVRMMVQKSCTPTNYIYIYMSFEKKKCETSQKNSIKQKPSVPTF